jgi:pyruvate formate lyase activating enzyme
VSAVLTECRDRGIDTAVETAGYGSWDHLERICRHANLILYDIKCMDADKHTRFTGVSNALILRNLSRLSIRLPAIPIVVRTPVIPGFNDTGKHISAIVKFLKTIGSLKKYELIPYHGFGVPKYGMLGKTYSCAHTDPPAGERMQRLRAIADVHKNTRENRLRPRDKA